MSASSKPPAAGPARPGPRPTFSRVTAMTLRALRALGVIARTGVTALLALVLVFEEWGWQPLAAALARLARFRLWARMETAIAELPPYVALGVLALPSVLILPLKLVALYLIAHG